MISIILCPRPCEYKMTLLPTFSPAPFAHFSVTGVLDTSSFHLF